MTDASDPGQAVERHERTSEPDLKRVQPGWIVYDRTGRRLGRVIERDDASVVVAGPRRSQSRVPLRLIADEQTEGRWATLSVTATDLASRRPIAPAQSR